MTTRRCTWAHKEVFHSYHDSEWGRPVTDDRLLFELLILEGAQAGLSWETVLTKRAHYKKAFDNFAVKKVASYSPEKERELLTNAGIIRNKLKISSAIKNARAFIEIQNEFGSFSSYIWNYVHHKPIINNIRSTQDIPAQTALSDQISQDLKNRGCSFVGSTITYAYLQSIGIVNDHENSCFCKHMADNSNSV